MVERDCFFCCSHQLDAAIVDFPGSEVLVQLSFELIEC